MPFIFTDKSTSYQSAINTSQGLQDRVGIKDKQAGEEFQNALELGLGIFADIGIAIATAGLGIGASATKWAAQASNAIIKTTGKSLVKQVAKNAIAGGIKGAIRGAPVATGNLVRKSISGKPLEGLKGAALVLGSAALTGALAGGLTGKVNVFNAGRGKNIPIYDKFFTKPAYKIAQKLGPYNNTPNPAKLALKGLKISPNRGGDVEFQQWMNDAFNSGKYFKTKYATYLKKIGGNARTRVRTQTQAITGKVAKATKEQPIFKFLEKANGNSIIDDILIKTASAPSLSSLATSLKTSFIKIIKIFFKGKIAATTYFKKFKTFEQRYKNYINKVFEKAKASLQLEERLNELKKTFKWEKVKSKFDNHFKKQHAELLDEYKKFRAGEQVDSKKLQNDMDNLVLQSQKAIPLDVQVGSQWILGYKWIIKSGQEGTGSLRVFFKSKISKRATKIIKKGKRKGTRIYSKPVKDAITFGQVPQDLFNSFISSPSIGSFYYKYFADKRLKGGGRESGWQPRSRVSISFLIDKQNENVLDTYGLEVQGAGKTLIAKSLGYNKTTNIAFKYLNKSATITQAIKNPASIATRATSSLRSRLSI